VRCGDEQLGGKGAADGPTWRRPADPTAQQAAEALAAAANSFCFGSRRSA